MEHVEQEHQFQHNSSLLFGAMMKRLVVVVLYFMIASTAFAQNKWVEGFYPGWMKAFYPPARIDYTAVTHVALAFWTTNANGTLNDPYGWNTTCSAVVTPAHAAGDKVIASIGGADDTNFATAVSTNMTTLIASMATVMSTCNLDGIDLDWEQSINNANFISLASTMRSSHPTWIITVPLDATVDPASLAAGLAPNVDQMNMQTYGLGNYFTTSSYFFPVFGSTNDYVDEYVAAWETAGVPAAKIGIGAGFYGNTWTSPVTGVGQASSGSTVNFEIPYGLSIANGGGILSCYYPPSTTATYSYDPSPALSSAPSHPPDQASLSASGGVTAPAGCPTGTVTWITYEDEASIAAKASYINSKGLGGIIVWSLPEGAVDATTGRNPLLDTLKLKLNNGSPAPLPQIGNSGSVTVNGATVITLTGFSNLGLVDIKWWNYASSVAWDDSSDTGFGTFGQPSAYTIQGSTNGTTWTTLTCEPSCTVTGEHYTGRQFVADLTGTGYTQIRMNITAMVGANAGGDTFTVNGVSTTKDINDSYLLFGDSITANCWGAATNTGPTEQFGTQVHAARPAQFPVATVGGQSGWLTSTALDTTTYGIPNIQKFMQDMPAVKYVGVSLGTNDANGSVSAATYCSNMQKIVQYIIQAGKTPVIPTIVDSPAFFNKATDPLVAYNACLATLEQNYPAIIPGPDLWTLFHNHQTPCATWWLSCSTTELHPSLGTGCTALQGAWATTMEAAVYPTATSSAEPATGLWLASK
jgi:chitinase